MTFQYKLYEKRYGKYVFKPKKYFKEDLIFLNKH